MKEWTTILASLAFIFVGSEVLAQFPNGGTTPTIPQPSFPNPLPNNNYQSPLQPPQPNGLPTSSSQSETIKRTNREVMKRWGYQPPPTQEEIEAARQAQLKGQPPALNRQQQQHLEIQRQLALLNDVSATDRYLQKNKFYESDRFKQSIDPYEKAFSYFNDMLEGRREVSLKDAYYEMESAYGGLQLSKAEYDQLIEKSANFIRQMILQAGLNLNDQQALHWGIQKFMGDTVTLKVKRTDNIGLMAEIPRKHLPFHYDYVDARAMDDFRNYFVTKTLATGTGQCNSLPAVYLILAEALGAETYLSFAPQHSFIKYIDENGKIRNYEPTVNWHFSDQDYIKEMPIMTAAIQNRMYLDTLNKEQVVASLMIDLGYGFYRKNWIADGTFIRKCIEVGASHIDNSNGNMMAQKLKSELFAVEFDRLFRKYGLTSLDQVNSYPEVHQAFQRYTAQERKLKAIGYQHFPEEKYQVMLEKHDKRGRIQLAKNMNTKSKKNLFVAY